MHQTTDVSFDYLSVMIVSQNFPLFVKRTKNIPGGFCKFDHTFQSHINITKQQSTVAARDLCQIGEEGHWLCSGGVEGTILQGRSFPCLLNE